MAVYTFAIQNRGVAIFDDYTEYGLDHTLNQSGSIQAYTYAWTAVTGGLILGIHNKGYT